MARPQVIQSRATAVAGSLAFASSVTAGNLLVAVISEGTAGTASVTDSLGSVWTRAYAVTTGICVTAMWYAVAASSGSCTVSATGVAKIALMEISGAQAVLDGTPTGATDPAGITTSPGSITTAGASSIVIVGLGGYHSDTTWTAPTGWTITQTNAGGDAVGIGWIVEDTALTLTPTITGVDLNSGTQLIAAFRATAATPRAAIGTLLKKGDGASPETFTAIAIVGNIDGPGLKADTIDTTNHDNADGYKTFIVTLLEGGDVKLSLFFDPTEATHTGLITDHQARTKRNWQIALPMSPVHQWSFAGYVTDLSNKYEVKNALMQDVTIKVSGKPVFS